MEENAVRINKFLSETGFCSRREADRLIEQGRVTINGKVPEMGTKVAPGDEVRVNGVLVEDKKQKHIFNYIQIKVTFANLKIHNYKSQSWLFFVSTKLIITLILLFLNHLEELQLTMQIFLFILVTIL